MGEEGSLQRGRPSIPILIQIAAFNKTDVRSSIPMVQNCEVIPFKASIPASEVMGQKVYHRGIYGPTICPPVCDDVAMFDSNIRQESLMFMVWGFAITQHVCLLSAYASIWETPPSLSMSSVNNSGEIPQ